MAQRCRGDVVAPFDPDVAARDRLGMRRLFAPIFMRALPDVADTSPCGRSRLKGSDRMRPKHFSAQLD
eukprot:6125287-Alexandrium_andersonii.AAC.1